MASSSNANAALTKATNKRKKTRAEMDAHNARCRSSRLRIKIRNNQTREENERIKKEMEEKNSELQQRVENEMLKHKRAVEEQRAMEAQMRQFPTSLEIEGQSFSTSEQMSEYLLSRTYEPHHQGVLDSDAGSFLENYDDWIEELLQPDAAAGISHTENLVVENQNNELVNQIDHNAMVQRREISPTQRSAENEPDRQDMPGHNMELERLRKVEAKYKEVVPLLNTMSQLAEESKQMNDTEPYLARRIQEVDSIRQHIQEMHNKSFDHG